MALPAGVTYHTKGVQLSVTQRGHWTPPYTSCMFAALSTILEMLGYDLPLKRGVSAYAGTNIVNFVKALHKASGRPLSEGSTLADSQTALRTLWANEDAKPPVLFGSLTEAELIDVLARGAAVRVTGGPLSVFPREWDLPAGYGSARHAFASNRPTRTYNGRREFYLIDPMFRPASGYVGQWVPFRRLMDLLDKTSEGRVIATWGFRSAAIPEPSTPEVEEMPLFNVRLSEVGNVAVGTEVFHLDGKTLMRKITANWTERAIIAETSDGAFLAMRGPNAQLCLVPKDKVTARKTYPSIRELNEQLRQAQVAEQDALAAASRRKNVMDAAATRNEETARMLRDAP